MKILDNVKTEAARHLPGDAHSMVKMSEYVVELLNDVEANSAEWSNNESIMEAVEAVYHAASILEDAISKHS